MDTRELQRQLLELLEPSVVHLGFSLVAVEWTSGPEGRLLRVSIDGPQGVSVAAVADVSEALSPVLDAADLIDQHYVLEVSSPGIERPVQLRGDFLRFKGYRARIRLAAGHPRRKFTGQLAGVEGDEVLVDVDGERHRLHFDDIERANLVLTLDEYQALGAPGGQP